MVGVFIWKCLIFPQNPFHKSHKALSPTHCYRRGITLREENILFGVSSQFLTDFKIFLLAPHSRADLYPSYLNPGKFGCLEFLGGIANRTFHGKSGFSTHAEDFEAPAKYLGNFTRRLWTCKIGPFCCREIQKAIIPGWWLVEKVGTKNLI